MAITAQLTKTSSRKTLVGLSLALVIGAAAVLLLRNITQVDFSAALATASRISATQMLLILTMAAGSYACLTGFDWLALRYVGHPLPYRQAALASFTALSLGHNIGLAALSSGAVRYRFYSQWGLGGVAIAKLIIFCGITVGLGLITLGGIALLCVPEVSGRITGTSPAVTQMLGGACLAVPIAYLGAAAAGAKPLRFRRWTLELPSLPLASGQVLIGTLNFALVAACLHQALNAVSEASYPAVVSVYVLANATAIASHVPGGLGIIEAAVVLLLPGANSLAAAILFRLAYYLVPLPLGLVTLATSELVYSRSAATRRSRS